MDCLVRAAVAGGKPPAGHSAPRPLGLWYFRTASHHVFDIASEYRSHKWTDGSDGGMGFGQRGKALQSSRERAACLNCRRSVSDTVRARPTHGRACYGLLGKMLRMCRWGTARSAVALANIFAYQRHDVFYFFIQVHHRHAIAGVLADIGAAIDLAPCIVQFFNEHRSLAGVHCLTASKSIA